VESGKWDLWSVEGGTRLSRLRGSRLSIAGKKKSEASPELPSSKGCVRDAHMLRVNNLAQQKCKVLGGVES
jgi:hypothetical protein